MAANLHNSVASDGASMTQQPQRIDPLTPEQRRYTMASVHSKHTKPEMKVRSLVHGMGYRYRLHRKDLPGKPDLVFAGRKKVIFVHGCFWHGHDCKAGRKRPKTNSEYWLRKLGRNKERDVANQIALHELGWRVLILWECQLKDMDVVAERVRLFLDDDPDE